MPSYVILTRLSPRAFSDPAQLVELADRVSSEIKRQCPAVRWKDSYATQGRFDVVDLVDSDDPLQAEKAAMIIRAYGHASTETLSATPWKQFIDGLRPAETGQSEGLFGDAVRNSQRWIDDVLKETGWDDPQRAYSTLRAVLHVLRDQLSLSEVADFGSNLPVLLRGMYFEGWRPVGRPEQLRHKDEFFMEVGARYRRNLPQELQAAVSAVFRVLDHYIPQGELDDVRSRLPADLRALWRSIAAVT